MQTLILVPIFLILASSFLPVSHQQSGFVTGGGLVIPPDRPSRQQRQRVRRNPNLKLIYNNRCGNTRWFTVRPRECPIAFRDPTFSSLQCNNFGSWGQVGRMFVFNQGRAHRGNRIRYCANVPIDFCPALARCTNNPTFPIDPIFPINPVNPIFPPRPPRCVCSRRTNVHRAFANCRTQDINDPRLRHFCYVDRDIRNRGCQIFPSRTRRGFWFSYEACPNNFFRGGREEEEDLEPSGELVENDASGLEDVGTDNEEFVPEILEP